MTKKEDGKINGDDSTIQPAFPPTIKLNQTSSIRIFLSFTAISIGFLVAKPLSYFLFPQPKVPWPKGIHPKNANDDNDESNLPLNDTLTIITGANSGVGYSLAKAHFQKGSKVILACRSEERGKQAIKKILIESNYNQSKISHDRLQLLNLDTSSMENVRAFVKEFKRSFPNKKIDYLFLNAGIAQKADNEDLFTSEGIQYMYATNFLGHFLMTGLLSASFSDQIRIILTSSHGAISGKFDQNLSLKGNGKPKSKEDLKNFKEETDFHFSKLPTYLAFFDQFISLKFLTRYGQTKAMQVVFSNILQQKFDQQQKSKSSSQKKFSSSFHPGFVASNIFKTFLRDDQKLLQSISQSIVNFFGVHSDQGCKTGLYLAHTFDARPGGLYDLEYELGLPWYSKMNEDLMNRLWTRWMNDANLSESDWRF